MYKIIVITLQLMPFIVIYKVVIIFQKLQDLSVLSFYITDEPPVQIDFEKNETFSILLKSLC